MFRKMLLFVACALLLSQVCFAHDGWEGQYFNEHTDQQKTAPSDGQVYQWDAAQNLWVLGTSSGDITSVGDCASAACFTGTSGTNLTFKGATSGTTILKPTAIAGSTAITLPAETGTVCTTGSICSGYQASGAVTSVTGTAPITSSGGATPAIGIPKGTSSADGYINATDWTTFNNKLNTTLASANIYVGNATNVTTAVAMSGDVAIDNAGATTIQANSVALGTDTTNNYVATVADSGASEVTVSGSGSESAAVTLAIASTITRDIEWDTWAEHPALLSAQILVGNATNVTANVTISGDGSLSNAGALTVNDDSHAHTSTTLPATVSYLGTTINETEMSLSNITTLNSNTTQHGFMPLLSGTATQYMDGSGNWTTPAGSGMQYSDTRYVVGVFTRDMTAASGNVAYTGIGFQPSFMIIWGVIDGTNVSSFGMMTSGAGNHIRTPDNTAGTTGLWSEATEELRVATSLTADQRGILSSFDSDGFTISWTKSGSPTGTAEFDYVAFK